MPGCVDSKALAPDNGNINYEFGVLFVPFCCCWLKGDLWVNLIITKGADKVDNEDPSIDIHPNK